MQTLTQRLQELHGQRTSVGCDGMAVYVVVTGSRVRYGRAEVEVTPLSGSGSTWVGVDRTGLDVPSLD